MVFTMNRRPLFGDHASGGPEPESKEMRHDGVEFHSPVRLTPMQENRDARDRNVGHYKRVENNGGPGPAGQAILNKPKETIQKTLPVRDSLSKDIFPKIVSFFMRLQQFFAGPPQKIHRLQTGVARAEKYPLG